MPDREFTPELNQDVLDALLRRIREDTRRQQIAASGGAARRGLQGSTFEAAQLSQVGEAGQRAEVDAALSLAIENAARQREERLIEEERIARQEEADRARLFSSEEAAKGRTFTAEEAEKARGFSSREAALAREFGAAQDELARRFASSEAAKGREFTTSERLGTEQFARNQLFAQTDAAKRAQQRDILARERLQTAELSSRGAQAALNFDRQKELAQLANRFQIDQQRLQNLFAQTENARDRSANIQIAGINTKADADRILQQQQFQRRENELDRKRQQQRDQGNLLGNIIQGGIRLFSGF